jgi:hypothetical protein
MNIVTKGTETRSVSSQADELTADELEHVWGGKPSAAPQDQQVRFLEFKMKEVLISGISA